MDIKLHNTWKVATISGAFLPLKPFKWQQRSNSRSPYESLYVILYQLPIVTSVIKQYPFVIWFIPRAWNVSIKSWCFWVIELTRGMYECSGDGLVKNNNIPNKMYGNVINRHPSISVKKLLCNYHDKKELLSPRVQIKQKILCILQLLIWLCLFIVWAFVHMHHAIIQL